MLLASSASRLVESTSTHACHVQSVALPGGAVTHADRLCPKVGAMLCVTLSLVLYFRTLGTLYSCSCYLSEIKSQ
jgi:hypothetical protein